MNNEDTVPTTAPEEAERNLNSFLARFPASSHPTPHARPARCQQKGPRSVISGFNPDNTNLKPVRLCQY